MFLGSCGASYSIATVHVNSLAMDKQCYCESMKVDRKSLLLQLIKTRFEGNQAAFARAIKKSPNQVNQWLTGYRSVGDGAARNIENMLGIGNLWMDGKEPGAPSIVAAPPLPLEEQVARLLAGMPDYYAEAWISKVKGHADMQRAEKRAAQEVSQQREKDCESAHDPTIDKRRASR